MNDHLNSPSATLLGSRRQFLAKSLAVVGGVVLGGTVLDLGAASASRRPASTSVLIGSFSSTTLGTWPVYEGIPDPNDDGRMKDLSANVDGVVHEVGTQFGGLGVTVLAGHRTSYNRPFRYIDQLPVGEVVRYDNTGDGTSTEFEVVAVKFPLDPVRDYDEVVGNDVAYGSDHRLNLYACCRANGGPTSTVYRIAAFCVAV